MASTATVVDDDDDDKTSRTIDSDDDRSWSDESSSDSDSDSDDESAAAAWHPDDHRDDDDTEASKSHMPTAKEIDEDDYTPAPPWPKESRTRTLTPAEASALIKGGHPMSLETARAIRRKREADAAKAKRAKRKAEAAPAERKDKKRKTKEILTEADAEKAYRESIKRTAKAEKRKVKEAEDAPSVCFMCKYDPADPSELTPDEKLTGGTRHKMCATCHWKLTRQKRCDVCDKVIHLPSTVGVRCECKRHDEHAMRCKPCLSANPILHEKCSPSNALIIPGFCHSCLTETVDRQLYDAETGDAKSVSADAPTPPCSPLAAAIRLVSGGPALSSTPGATEATELPCRFLVIDRCRQTHPNSRMFCFSCDEFQCRGCMRKCADCKMVSCWMCNDSCSHVRPPSYNLTVYQRNVEKSGDSLDTKHKPTLRGDGDKPDLKSFLLKYGPIARCPGCKQIPLDQCTDCSSCQTPTCPRCGTFNSSPTGVRFECKNCVKPKRIPRLTDSGACSKCKTETMSRCHETVFACLSEKCRDKCGSCGALVCFGCLIVCSSDACTGTVCVNCTDGKGNQPTQVELYCIDCRY